MTGSTDEAAARLILDRERRAARIVLHAAALDVKVVEPIERLVEEAAASDVQRVELDLAAASFADSSVVRLALKAREHLAPKGAEMVIRAPDAVRRLFDLTGTAELFRFLAPDDPALG